MVPVEARISMRALCIFLDESKTDAVGRQLYICPKFSLQDLDNVVRILLHKGGESNAFIREDVEKALTEMVNSVSPGRSLTALISGGLS